MPKRKFSQCARDTAGKRHDPHQRDRVQDILGNRINSIHRALKLAQGFERQKSGRRRKTAEAQKNKAVIERLKEELEVLKALDLLKIAEIQLYKTLLKIKSIATSNLLPEDIQRKVHDAKQSLSTANANVQARLFNSAPVKTAMNEAVENVRDCIHKNSNVPESDVVQNGAGESFRSRSSTLESFEDLSNNEDSVHLRGRVLAESPVPASASTDGEGMKAFADRITESEDEESLGSVERHTGSDWSGSDDFAKFDSETSSMEEEKQVSAANNVVGSKPATSDAKPKSTTFLPTLSMGGYWSGSGEGSDIDDSVSKIQVRKNKRGQRARQKIWELKHGANANHLKKAAQDRSHGWDPRRGAQANEDLPKWKRGHDRRERSGVNGRTNRRDVRGPLNSGPNAEPVKPRVKKVEERPMHPSWEAAKKKKEQKLVIPFQGKKITF